MKDNSRRDNYQKVSAATTWLFRFWLDGLSAFKSVWKHCLEQYERTQCSDCRIRQEDWGYYEAIGWNPQCPIWCTSAMPWNSQDGRKQRRIIAKHISYTQNLEAKCHWKVDGWQGGRYLWSSLYPWSLSMHPEPGLSLDRRQSTSM